MVELIRPLDRLSRREHFTAEDDLVFCNEVGEHLHAWALRRRYDAALERAELRRVRFHDLRQCFGSVAVRVFPLSDVQAILGPQHVTTTMRYVHHRPGADDAAKPSSACRENEDNSAQLTVPASDVWSRAAPQAGACKAVYTGSIPVGASPSRVAARDTGRAMSRENVEVVRRALAAFERDLADGQLGRRVPEFFDPAVVYHAREAPSPFFGHAGLIRGLVEWFDVMEIGDFRLERLVDSANHVIAEMTVVSKGRRSGATVAASLWLVFTLRGEKVVALREYAEEAQALEAAGLPS